MPHDFQRPYLGMAQARLQGALDPDDPYAAAIAALEDESQQQFVPGQFRGSPLEAFQGLQGFQLPYAPRGFGQGFGQALLQGLGQAGAGAASKREEFAKQEALRRAELDKRRLEASQRLREAGTKSKLHKEERADKAAAEQRKEDEAKSVPSKALLQEHPWLTRYMDAQGRIPEWVARATLPEKEGKSLEQIAAEAEAAARGRRRGAPPVSQTGRPPSAVERERLTVDEAATQQITDLEGLYKKDFVGPAVGRLAAATAAGLPVPGGLKQGQADFMAALAQLRNAVISQLAGSTVSGAEAARMEQQLPNINQPSEVFEANMRQTRRNIERLSNARRKTLEAAGVEVGSARSRVPNVVPEELSDEELEAEYNSGGFR